MRRLKHQVLVRSLGYSEKDSLVPRLGVLQLLTHYS